MTELEKILKEAEEVTKLEKEVEDFIIKHYELDKLYCVDSKETRQYMRADVHNDYEEEYQCYLAGAKAYIEKMKCCENCRYNLNEDEYITSYCDDCFELTKWEMK